MLCTHQKGRQDVSLAGLSVAQVLLAACFCHEGAPSVHAVPHCSQLQSPTVSGQHDPPPLAA
jgi:hypothetical protein